MLDLSRLSPEQRNAVLAPPGPLALIAGPGSGKTTVLVARIASLIALGQVTPATVLALTFSRVAVRTLRTRLQGLLGDQAAPIDVQTFHALGLRIIRQWSDELGFGPLPPVVYGEGDVRELLHEAIAAVGFDRGERSLHELTQRLARRRLEPEGPGEWDSLGELADAYENLLLRRNAVDYPAMLGVVQNQDSYAQGVAAQRPFYFDHIAELTDRAFDEFAKLTGRRYARGRKVFRISRAAL